MGCGVTTNSLVRFSYDSLSISWSLSCKILHIPRMWSPWIWVMNTTLVFSSAWSTKVFAPKWSRSWPYVPSAVSIRSPHLLLKTCIPVAPLYDPGFIEAVPRNKIYGSGITSVIGSGNIYWEEIISLTSCGNSVSINSWANFFTSILDYSSIYYY